MTHRLLLTALAGLVLTVAPAGAERKPNMTQTEIINEVLAKTKPLHFPRGERLPLYVWTITGVGTDDEAEAERVLKELDARGIPVIAVWRPNDKEKALERALWLGRIQQRLELPICVNANACSYPFFNGDESTLHVGDDGKPFADQSFPGKKMGCPFALEERLGPMKQQVDFFVRAYQEAGLPLDFVFYDWEIDGPTEWNDAWAHSKKCTRCREHLPSLDNFREFQAALRLLRSRCQRECLARPVLARFPNAMVGNYHVNPHDGYRYWYDWYESDEIPAAAARKLDQRGKYRAWFHEFPPTEFTCSMPVVYPWYRNFTWYDYSNPDFRWFYSLLLEVSSSGGHTAKGVPSIPFVHWQLIPPTGKEPDPSVKQFSIAAYQELLWHLLLRGHDTFFLWCPGNDTGKELPQLHEVYAASLEYADFLTNGQPVTFDVPKRQSPVVSGVRLGNRVLVRRTDFTDAKAPVVLKVGDQEIRVPRADGKCQIVDLK
ncbi:MAG: hypothetical protein COZ06_30925 [Armatimonadetes bacterium CG_4_10_14_3_um_filter_66_18]|nr:hypothetical protein [Armatimonadota bacterium]OIP09345.1 MAG: hypothetical protein AUJ96_05310 [Armatimonadetes bacterium CG2_30_66_41]PIU87944.1 MAG: hypothetical protein COS65_32065 [Armatimonadetes bacterium CG06_land_8_20_14_3_00_66_21]PIX46613.1 MAG: hypothetical protein COZ57_11135 [Armatimonadetes bacterium CG_4_8_14_3_um_filter_66_20]PIY38603.1 MAG: hypothetical protein COZ06_30925 [Armatimonadetes bacterium CG_4_10_14_3_um_filter_66_18]PIZ45489.1 MAG: hypothetical protein COY42_12